MKSRANGFFTLFSERHLSMSSEFYSSEPSDCRGKRANPDYNSWPTHNLNDQGIKYDHSVASTKVMAPGRQKAAGAVHVTERLITNWGLQEWAIIQNLIRSSLSF
uniref:Uncharacterized protein n=1 Tax=Salix viminalis TaxID=40686 RepID=A0A6N2KSF3_SALVM